MLYYLVSCVSYKEKHHYKAELQLVKENEIHLLIIGNLCKQCLNQAAQRGLKFHVCYKFRERDRWLRVSMNCILVIHTARPFPRLSHHQ